MTSRAQTGFQNLEDPFQEDDFDSGIDLRQILATLQRYKWTLLTLPLAGALITWLFTNAIAPTYQASATLILEGDALNVVSIEQIYDPTASQSRDYIATQLEIMRSRSLLEATVDRLNLTEDPRVLAALRATGLIAKIPGLAPDEDPVSSDPEQRKNQVVGWMRANLQASPVRNTSLIELRFSAPSRKLAADIVNGHGEAYIDSGLEARLEVTERAASWLTDRLEGLRQNLQEAESALQDFRERNQLVDISSGDSEGGVLTMASRRLQELNTRLLEQQQERLRAENAIELIADAPQERWATSSAVVSNPAMQELLRTRTAAESRIAELSGRYGPRHPEMISANVELEQIRSAIDARADDVVASLRDQARRARATEADLRQQIQDAETQVQRIQRQTSELRELQRNVDTNRRLYDMFLQRFQETRQANFQEATARFIEKAQIARQVAPQPAFYSIIAFVLSLGLAAGCIFLREMLNNTLRALHDVEDKLHLPLLGSIPALKLNKQEKSKARTLFVDTEKGNFAEAIRSIRTGVVLSGLDTPHKIITVTSAIPGEGKTTVSTNLALAFSQLERTILLDADMRRPDLAREFNLPMNRGGISNVISGNAKLEEAIHTLESGLDVLPAGIVPPNPLELLSSKRFQVMLEALKKRYDRIIIDTAPVNAASDALVLSTLSDALVFVARFESTPLPAVRNSLNSFRQVNAPIIGMVVNLVDLDRPDRYGYYGYYYNYGGYYTESKSD